MGPWNLMRAPHGCASLLGTEVLCARHKADARRRFGEDMNAARTSPSARSCGRRAGGFAQPPRGSARRTAVGS